MIYAIPFVMLLGLLYGLKFDALKLKKIISPATFLMIYPMMITMDVRKIFSKSSLKLQLFAQLINFCILPFVAFGIGLLFFEYGSGYLVGFLLTALLPTSGMTITWTAFANGNKEGAVQLTIFGLTIGSILTPFYLKLFFGKVVSISLASTMLQIAVLIFIPMLLGHISRVFLIKRVGLSRFMYMAPKFSSLSTAGVLAIVFVAVSLKATSIFANPKEVIFLLIPLSIFYAINYIIGILVGILYFNRENGVALIFGTVMRNLSIALAIAVNFFDASAALIISLSYLVQIQSATIAVRLYSRYSLGNGK